MEITAKIEILEKNKEWEPWDLDKEFNPNYYREKGYLEVEERPAFRKIVDACNCLGQNYISVQQAWFKVKFIQITIYGFQNFTKMKNGIIKSAKTEK